MVFPLKNCSGVCAVAGTVAAAINPAARIAARLVVLLGIVPPWNAGPWGRACTHTAGMCPAMPPASGDPKAPAPRCRWTWFTGKPASSGRLRHLVVEGQPVLAGGDRHPLTFLDA